MADIFVTEELTDESEENPVRSFTFQVPEKPQPVIQNDIEVVTSTAAAETKPEIQVVNEESDGYSLNCGADSSNSEKESESSQMLKQEQDVDPLSVDGLLVNPDDLLPPVEKLEKYAESEIAFNRQVVVRNLLETLRVVQEDQDQVSRVVIVMMTLSEDYDPIVRSELMGQFPHIATFFKEKNSEITIRYNLWPIMINYMGTDNSQVRKAAHTTLLSIVEQKLIDLETMTLKICPLVVHLTDRMHPEELRTDSVVLMSKLAVLLGKQMTEDLFFPYFLLLCADPLNSVRKAAASAFGDICSTVGKEITEELLLPKFIELCKDAAWCVRKACAENFMPVSCVVSRKTRCTELSEIYMVLLKDLSRWVRVTAYQGLGPFISTFAEPEKTGLYYSKDGVLTIVDIPETSEKQCGDVCLEEQCIIEKNCSKKSETVVVEKSKTCDSIVPLSSSNKPLSASEIPGISCHVGNYCTVIEVSGSETTTDNAIPEVPCQNGLSHSDFDNSKNLDTLYKELQKEVEKHKLKVTSPLVNGDINRIVNDIKDYKIENNQKENTTLVKSELLNSELVNCIYVVSSSKNSETLNCQSIPLINCINTKKNHTSTGNQILSSVSEGVKSRTESESLSKSTEIEASDASAFNHFQYWRVPLPEFDVSEITESFEQKCSFVQCDSGGIRVSARDKRCASEDYRRSTVELSGNTPGEPPPEISVYDQDIVPPELLKSYLEMIDATWTEVAHHCAYSLPAVAFTLGRKYWPCLKETFEALSSDLQGFIMMWKVRRTVASSMHQLAVILGPDITSTDLVPVFSKFIYDLDEVRIGILQHISEFLKVLRPEERKEFLPALSEFLECNSNNENSDKNWRFRLIFAEQLAHLSDLYDPQDVKDNLVPLALTLIQDKICEVRLAAVRVMASVMRRMSEHPTSELTKAVLTELSEKFIHSPKWIHRQLYVYVCQEFIVESSLPPDQFAEDALPQLLYLCWDRVPNVRIAIARCLAVVLWPLEAFSSPDSLHRELLLQTIHTLQGDCDGDVRFYSNMVSTLECSCLQHGEFSNLPV